MIKTTGDSGGCGMLMGPFAAKKEPEHKQYLAKNPGGYCGLGGTGVACPSRILEAARR